ncbi:hypothetical protein [Aestuariibacter salexigens]|uniref:hypothetical protein n=1 Tax=Aestuariibacter salexigens TaxID=226010 RepID=UPI0012EC37E2|nr:hypothetical protein [Aestuariibacter salexigens]
MTIPALHQRAEPRRHRRNLSGPALAFSITAHVLLGVVLWLHDGERKTHKPDGQLQTIRSYLYQAPAQPVPTPDSSTPIVEQKSDIIEELTPPPAVNQEIALQSAERQAQPVAPVIDPSQASANYFSRQNKQALNALSNRESQQYKQRKNTLRLPESSVRSAEEQHLIGPDIKEVDCGNAGKQALAMFSGLVGGTVRCREYADIDRFIDARVNKLPNDPLASKPYD